MFRMAVDTNFYGRYRILFPYFRFFSILQVLGKDINFQIKVLK